MARKDLNNAIWKAAEQAGASLNDRIWEAAGSEEGATATFREDRRLDGIDRFFRRSRDAMTEAMARPIHDAEDAQKALAGFEAPWRTLAHEAAQLRHALEASGDFTPEEAAHYRAELVERGAALNDLRRYLAETARNGKRRVQVVLG